MGLVILLLKPIVGKKCPTSLYLYSFSSSYWIFSIIETLKFNIKNRVWNLQRYSSVCTPPISKYVALGAHISLIRKLYYKSKYTEVYAKLTELSQAWKNFLVSLLMTALLLLADLSYSMWYTKHNLSSILLLQVILYLKINFSLPIHSHCMLFFFLDFHVLPQSTVSTEAYLRILSPVTQPTYFRPPPDSSSFSRLIFLLYFLPQQSFVY